MKKFILIVFTLAIVAVSIIFVYKLKQIPTKANSYIKDKKEQLYEDAVRQVDSLFVHKHTDIFPIYYECKSRFVKGNAESQTGSMFKDVINKSFLPIQMPTDITSTYRVAPENPMFFYDRGNVEYVKMEIRMQNHSEDVEQGIIGANWKGLWQTGWALGVRENWGLGKIAEYIIIPYAVSFRKQSFGSLEGYISIDEILNNAYKFYTENDKSDYKRNIVHNVKNFSWGPYIDNRYYYIVDANESNYSTMTISSFADYSTYMYNDSYYVFIKGYGKKMYELELIEDRVKYDKEQYISEMKHSILKYGLSSLVILLAIWSSLLFFVIKEMQESRLTLLQRIIIQTNPKRFMKNYVESKMESANDIYSKALSIDITDDVGILELASRAESELGIILVSRQEFDSLCKRCNPKHFMKPYDAEKVAKANALYAKLKQKELSRAAFSQIKTEVEQLYGRLNEDTSHLVSAEDS